MVSNDTQKNLNYHGGFKQHPRKWDVTLEVCNNTQENMELGWRFLLALKEMSNYLDIWLSTQQCICILLEVYVTSQGTTLLFMVLFWHSRKFLSLKV